MNEKPKKPRAGKASRESVGAKSSVVLGLHFDKIEETPTAINPQIVAESPLKQEAPNPPQLRAIDPARLADACENGPKVPDLSDLLAWQGQLLANPYHFLQQLFPRFAILISSPPLGFGFPVARAVLATWHLRAFAEQKNPSGWNALGMAALDVVSNAVALWHIFPCPCCGRRLHEHTGEVLPNMRTMNTHREAGELKEYQLAPPLLCVFDCGFPLRIPSWFPEAMELPFPHTPATCEKVRPVARIVSREYLWRCLKQEYRKDDSPCFIADVVAKLFGNSTNKHKLAELNPGGHASTIIRDGATEIERAYKRLARGGVAGAGLGILLYNGQMVFAVA